MRSLFRRRRGRHTDRSDRYDDLWRAACLNALPAERVVADSEISRGDITLSFSRERRRFSASDYSKRRDTVALIIFVPIASHFLARSADGERYRDYNRERRDAPPSLSSARARHVLYLIIYLMASWKRNARGDASLSFRQSAEFRHATKVAIS